MMKASNKKPFLVFSCIVLLCLVTLMIAIFRTNHVNLQSVENPLASLKQPFQKVDAALIADGNESVLVRIVDASGYELFLLVLKDIKLGKYTTVIKNADAEWLIEDSWHKGFSNIKTPASIAEAESNYELFKNPKVVISDLAIILEKYRNNNDRYYCFAYDALQPD